MQLPYHNLQMKHWNPGASQPLILPIQMVCNTDDDVLHSNIRVNSSLPNEWINAVPEHLQVALLCGSGPSIADHVGEIRQLQLDGAVVFALNGCAKFLNDRGSIMPDYQVILDARLQTADLIGPAKQHLFASQVHPECFKRKSAAKLWHVEVEKIDDLLPEAQPEHVLIGGAASVGNTATCLAYALGFRTLYCYGYDSSNKGEVSHAFRQPMNDGEPMAYVDFNGQVYLCSLTMKMQAEKFMTTSQDLKALGCRIEVFGEGLLPDMFRAPKEVLAEADKYTVMWSNPAYREVSPGELIAGKFLELIKDLPGKIIDFGCGTGRGSIRIAQAGYEVHLVDFTENSRDPDALRYPFTQADITLPMHVKGGYAFCADVMEHLPPESVNRTIHNIMACVEQAGFFQISTVHDEMGALINEPLHLTVRPHHWWRGVFQGLGYRILWDQESSTSSCFFIGRG